MGLFSPPKESALSRLGGFVRRHRKILLIIAAALLARLIATVLLSPLTDVYYYDKDAARALLFGLSPYGYFFGPLPSSIMGTPGAEYVFTYLPFTALYLVPFYILGDVRYGLILADVVIGACIVGMKGKRSIVPATLYLLLPARVLLSTIFLNNTVISMLFISLFFLLERRGNGTLSALCFGIALTVVQFSWLIFPFVAIYYLRDRRWREPGIMVAVAALIILPYFMRNPTAFLYDTFTFQFVRPTMTVLSFTGPLGYYLNLAMNSVFLTLFHFGVPEYVRIALVMGILPFFLRDVRDSRRLALYSGIYVLVTLFILPNVFFLSYAELPFLLFLLFLSSPKSAKVKRLLRYPGVQKVRRGDNPLYQSWSERPWEQPPDGQRSEGYANLGLARPHMAFRRAYG